MINLMKPMNYTGVDYQIPSDVVRKVKEYPLEIENVGEDTYIVMSRGHHDPHEFMKQVREDGYSWPLGMPQHKWARAVPTRNRSMSCIYVFTEPHARGAFPCTYSWEAYNEDAYEVIVKANHE